ncbi:hypothetical protein M770_34685 (plasmid) [Pseudomonas aeruginosa VRFPA03]|nr:hypothetical protein M770_34685 [Pseudomonas aeruginosa VRFPA03]
MHIRILGSAAGGGFPQWNCNCPEGGLSDAEVEQAQAAGFHAARLGPRVLRTETAPVVALAVAQQLWGDFA